MADEIPASLQRLVEFLNEHMPRIEVLAVEIRQYRAAAGTAGALVPRLIGQTSRAQATKERPAPVARRRTRWTASEVLETIAQGGDDAATVASVILDWAAAHPHIEITGGTGGSYPSVTMSADTGRSTSRLRGVLSLYGSTRGERPMLEVRVKRLCRTPPYNRTQVRSELTAGLRALGIGRLETESALTSERPNIPLAGMTTPQAQRLLTLIDRWITDVRTHAKDPETGEESPAAGQASDSPVP